jgi:hypothetical protein
VRIGGLCACPLAIAAAIFCPCFAASRSCYKIDMHSVPAASLPPCLHPLWLQAPAGASSSSVAGQKTLSSAPTFRLWRRSCEALPGRSSASRRQRGAPPSLCRARAPAPTPPWGRQLPCAASPAPAGAGRCGASPAARLGRQRQPRQQEHRRASPAAAHSSCSGSTATRSRSLTLQPRKQGTQRRRLTGMQRRQQRRPRLGKQRRRRPGQRKRRLGQQRRQTSPLARTGLGLLKASQL